MKNTQLFLLVVCFFAAASCNRNDSLISIDEISGSIQKGPYLIGTSITIIELTNELIPTGKNYHTQVHDNLGSFEVSQAELESPYVEIKADGFFFNEVRNDNSEAQLTLYALVDLSDSTHANANVLTTLEKERVEYLYANGMSFREAKLQALTEVLKIFQIELADTFNSEQLDISQPGLQHNILLATSLLLMGARDVAEVSELLAGISNDIREDGILDSYVLNSLIYSTAKALRYRLGEITTNTSNRYKKLGIEMSVPDLITYFTPIIENPPVNNDANKFEGDISYPTFHNSHLNVLCDSNFIVQGGVTYAIAAYLPKGSMIKVVAKPTDGINWGAAGFVVFEADGFDVSSNNTAVVMTAIGNDENVNLPIMFGGDASVETQTSIDFLIYENNSPESTWVKTVRNYQE